MTHPPQPGGPYPQQPYPQQPYRQPQYPQQQPYSQQQWAQPGHPPPGYPRQPKKKSLLWLWICLGVVVVLAAGVAITGFVAPGFFLNKNHPVGASRTLPEPQFMTELLGKLNVHDLDGAAAYVCESADESPASLVHGHFADPQAGNYRVRDAEPLHEITQFVHVDSDHSGNSLPFSSTFMLRKGPDGGFCLFGVI
ncbi:hypothetical protein VSH64_44590 [Amycolatopsis rhabdoformis]|uniref:Uncharacterized protein n=1 Tax=Amycolatopsis rhabdoformis TaxID=1448059 RepID=A0ABZ1I754_9PSEU|nr:hypothetical protein [Amycolatopsis rhabdoformis]WSE29796.1 hypothetical protein VSH64_44590 [Amycolatopsis rhabdoformis]